MHKMDIREEECWKQFESSGKIEDYLSFVSSVSQMRKDVTGQVREENYAGIYMGNGNHIETVPGGRVR